jgi:hypothetical protein
LQELEFYISLYNSQLPVGQETVFDPEAKLFKGTDTIRSIRRVINVFSEDTVFYPESNLNLDKLVLGSD